MKISKIVKLFSLFIVIGTLNYNIASAGIFANKSHKASSSGEGNFLEFQNRTYLLHTPPSLTAGQKVPLVIVLHGGFGNAEGVEKALGFNTVADQNSLMVAYLNGTGSAVIAKNMRAWNSGNCCGIAEKKNINDVQFIDDFIKEMISRGNIDPSRIYLVGHSNGSMMSYRFVCERPNVIAAIVTFSGTLTADRCNNAGSVQILEVHSMESIAWRTITFL